MAQSATVENYDDLDELETEADELSEEFLKAAEHLKGLVSQLNEQILLNLYSYYKQGTEGPCNIPRPSWYNIKSKAKWDAWEKLGNMDPKDAKRSYIQLIKNLDSDFGNSENKEKWVSVSTLQHNDNILSESEKSIFDYVKEGNYAKVICILKSNNFYNSLNDLDEDGIGLIHWAADRGHSDIMEALILHGANVNLRDAEMQTPLHYAAFCGHMDCINVLLKNNANLTFKDQNGSDPKDVAIDTKVKELLIIMFSTGAKHLNKCIPENRLKGRVAIITGSTYGIGFGIAKRMAQEGAKVVISSRKQTNVDVALSQFAMEGLSNSVVGIVCHVGKADDRKKLFDEATKLGGLDILVSNAAINISFGPILECSEEAWDKIFDINVKASFMLAKEALPLLRRSDNGRIILLSSVAAYQTAPNLGPYPVTRTALLGLNKAIALDLAIENITVNCIAPGLIETPSAEKVLKRENVKKYVSNIPMNRLGKVEDVAGLAAYLASEDSKYITGEIIIISGGFMSRL
ncbi:hypothetical protein FQA39_LY07374 [Lamprigera yunnana]|nr:hypothetical protein FQA39_LY07374 [Lamprigera yunnana]